MAAVTANASPATVVDIGHSTSKSALDKPKSTLVSAWCSEQWKPILAEFVSTAMLLFFGCMSNVPINGLTEQNPIYSPLGFGLTVLINVQIFGHLSGAHMNPAVTLTAIIWGNTSITLGIFYVIVQVMGATVGYGLLVGLAPMDVTVNGICMTVPHPGLNEIQTLAIETLLTGTLCFLCCALWDPVNNQKQDSAAIKFGLAVTGLSITGGPLTGASMNPARTLGPAIWTGIWTAHWTYWVGPFVGSSLATTMYKFVFLRNHKHV